MPFINHPTHTLYRRILAEQDMAKKEAIYLNELVAPFTPLFQIFGNLPPIDWMRFGGAFTPDSLIETPPALEILEKNDAWEITSQALAKGLACFEPHHLNLPEVQFGIFLTDPTRLDPIFRGYSGMGSLPGFIMVFISEANAYVLSKLAGLTVHELHHNIRFSLTPWIPGQVRMADWMISEGLAESFAVEIFGQDMLGYYVTDFDPATYDHAYQLIREGLSTTDMNAMRSYIFGKALTPGPWGAPIRDDIPAFAGYHIGYQIVQQYLQRTGKSVVDATFVSSDELIRESRFFA